MIQFYCSRILKSRLAVAGLALISLLLLAAVIGPYLPLPDANFQNLSQRLAAPSARHWLGTDDLGRDVFARMVGGARISLTVGLIAVLISTLIGTLVGLISGYVGGKVDAVLMRAVDVLLCFPTFFLILMVIAFLEPNIVNVMIIIGLTSWTSLARLVRAETLSIKAREYILAAQALGLPHWRILLVHILPNVIAPILVSATLGVGSAILTESSLSFLGLGVQPPMASWGSLLTTGKDYIHFAWWLSVFPGLAILLTTLAFNLLGEGLQNALDPRQ